MRRYGFTLIELLVVIAIIAILAAILFSRFQPSKRESASVSMRQQCSQHCYGLRAIHLGLG
ncbi:MAG: hypothetical protein DFNUSKGM_001194 [Candidatus Fervidibacter sacchari]